MGVVLALLSFILMAVIGWIIFVRINKALKMKVQLVHENKTILELILGQKGNAIIPGLLMVIFCGFLVFMEIGNEIRNSANNGKITITISKKDIDRSIQIKEPLPILLPTESGPLKVDVKIE